MAEAGGHVVGGGSSRGAKEERSQEARISATSTQAPASGYYRSRDTQNSGSSGTQAKEGAHMGRVEVRMGRRTDVLDRTMGHSAVCAAAGSADGYGFLKNGVTAATLRSEGR